MIFRPSEQLTSQRLSSSKHPKTCLQQAWPLAPPCHSTSPCTHIPNQLFHWDTLQIWSHIHSCLRTTRTCPPHFNKRLQETALTTSLWQQPLFYLSTRTTSLSAVCPSRVLVFLPGMGLAARATSLESTSLSTKLPLLWAQILDMMML